MRRTVLSNEARFSQPSGTKLRARQERNESQADSGVIADDAFDGDAEGGVEREGSFQHAGRGGALLVLVDLRVSDPGVVIDDGVDVVITGETPISAATCATSRPDWMRWTMINLPAGASRALAWDTRGVRVFELQN